MKFIKDQFVISGSSSEYWVHYNGDFVGCFKHGSAKASANHFIKFLMNNFTVEEYFSKMEEVDSSPVRILEQKGYVAYNTAKILKKEGYAPTREALMQYFKDKSLV